MYQRASSKKRAASALRSSEAAGGRGSAFQVVCQLFEQGSRRIVPGAVSFGGEQHGSSRRVEQQPAKVFVGAPARTELQRQQPGGGGEFAETSGQLPFPDQGVEFFAFQQYEPVEAQQPPLEFVGGAVSVDPVAPGQGAVADAGGRQEHCLPRSFDESLFLPDQPRSGLLRVFGGQLLVREPEAVGRFEDQQPRPRFLLIRRNQYEKIGLQQRGETPDSDGIKPVAGEFALLKHRLNPVALDKVEFRA